MQEVCYYLISTLINILIKCLFRYLAFMRDHCQRACDLCPLVPSSILTTNPIVDTNCKDKDKRCSAWAAYANQCHTNRLFMSKVCKETCGYPCISEDHQLDTPESSLGLRKAISGKWLLMLMLSTIFSSSSTLLVMKWSETKSCNRILLSLQLQKFFLLQCLFSH